MLAYGEELELVKDNVKVVWENIGEGYSGYYDENDPRDENFLRWTVYICVDGVHWEQVEDASYCTLVKANTPTEELMKKLEVLMKEFYNVLHKDPYASVKKLAESLSWIS